MIDVVRTGRGVPDFELCRVAASPGPVPMRGGLALTPDRTLAWLPRAGLILVLGLDDLTPAPEPVLAARRRAHAPGTTIAAPCGLLERTDLPLPEVARRSGFGSEVTMRQHFTSWLATSPRAYRASFAAPDRPCR